MRKGGKGGDTGSDGTIVVDQKSSSFNKEKSIDKDKRKGFNGNCGLPGYVMPSLWSCDAVYFTPINVIGLNEDFFEIGKTGDQYLYITNKNVGLFWSAKFMEGYSTTNIPKGQEKLYVTKAEK